MNYKTNQYSDHIRQIIKYKNNNHKLTILKSKFNKNSVIETIWRDNLGKI